MSSLDKAFIKAYRKSSAQSLSPKPASVHHLSIVRQMAVTAVPSAEPLYVTQPNLAPAKHSQPRPADSDESPRSRAESIGADSAARPKEPIPFTRFHAAHAEVPTPHAKFIEPPPTAPALAPSAADTIAPAQATGTVATAASSRAAEASPAPQDSQPSGPRPVILPLAAAALAWRPVFEVVSLSWPDVAETLLEAAFVQFRAAAGELAEASRRHRKLVAVTSAHRGEGCTSVTLALAKVLAEQQRVAVVDAHFDSPTLADSLGMAAQVGWEETLMGDKPLTEALVESIEDRLIVLPLRQPAAEDWNFSVPRLKASFDELRKHCDLVLIDAGPIGEPGDRRRPLAWAAPCRVDRALVVRDLRTTGNDQVTEIDRRLQGSGIAQWNFVDNFAAA
jgi:Mrp family chromosome partitioning ATPase